MFGLFSPTRRRQRCAPARHFRPALEGLGSTTPAYRSAPRLDRDCRPALERLESREAPASITVNISYGTGHDVTLSGTLTANNPAGVVVKFKGCGLPTNTQTTTDASGNYSITLTLPRLGLITAYGTADGSMFQSSVLASNTAPVISNFGAEESVGNVWTFSGQVTDEHAEGLVVTFGGIQSLEGKTAVVGADGWFYLTIQLSGQTGDTGTATAQITSDWWGLASNVVGTLVDQSV